MVLSSPITLPRNKLPLPRIDKTWHQTFNHVKLACAPKDLRWDSRVPRGRFPSTPQHFSLVGLPDPFARSSRHPSATPFTSLLSTHASPLPPLPQRHANETQRQLTSALPYMYLLLPLRRLGEDCLLLFSSHHATLPRLFIIMIGPFHLPSMRDACCAGSSFQSCPLTCMFLCGWLRASIRQRVGL